VIGGRRSRALAGRRLRLLPESGWSAALTGWIAVATSFLAVLTLAAGLAAVELGGEWRADLAGVATVRVAETAAGTAAGTDAGEGVDERLRAVLEVLRTTPGIAGARSLSDAEQAALVAPWLGDAAGLGGLALPRLIDVRLDGDGPDAARLQGRLDMTVEGAVYDDHAAWRRPLVAAAEGLTRLAFAATALVLATAALMVALAARATLAANRHVIEIVRLVGAEDRFISTAFVRRLARRAAVGGAVGAALGCGALALLPSVPGEAGLAVELRPRGAGWVALGLGVPLAGTLVAWLAARTTVRLTLRRMP
jgi:cell division transport system permease protein